jgi:long-chain acyl-CoA synthetase
MNLATIFRGVASRFTTKPVLRYRDADVLFSEFSDQVARFSGHLNQRGIRLGDRVMIFARNKPEWLVSFVAALERGAVVIPVNPALTASEVLYMVEQAGPRLIVADDDLVRSLPVGRTCIEILAIGEAGCGTWYDALPRAQAVTEILDVADTDPALMHYTSGTTGRPKGALLSHGAEIFAAKMVASHFRLRPDDISLISNSLAFIYPLVINCLASIHAGATVVLQERFHPGLCLRGIEREKATVFMGVPTMFTMMLDWGQKQDVDASSFRLCLSAAQNLPWKVATRFKDRFGISVYDLWGQTEGTPITSFDPSTEPEGRPESCGRALPGCGVKIIDNAGAVVGPDVIGEVLLSGPNVFIGYDQNPQATAETLRNGWVHTGDLGKLDSDGYLYIVGRKHDLVIRGGANIYPTEVEEAIHADPAVSECAVIGVPDEIYGETLRAFVVVGHGVSLTESELIEYCRTRLAAYKVPSSVTFVDALPKGPTGKILKPRLHGRAARIG